MLLTDIFFWIALCLLLIGTFTSGESDPGFDFRRSCNEEEEKKFMRDIRLQRIIGLIFTGISAVLFIISRILH